MTPEERAAIYQRAADRARARGLRTDPEPAAPDAPRVVLPTLRPSALRALLQRGHLTPAQADAARRVFAAADAYVRQEQS